MGLLSILDKIVVGENPLKPTKEKSGGSLLEKLFGGAKPFGDMKLFGGDNKQQFVAPIAYKGASESGTGTSGNNSSGGSSNWNTRNTHEGFYSAGKTSDNRPLNSYSSYAGGYSYHNETNVVEIPVYVDRLDERDPFYEIHNQDVADAAVMGRFGSVIMDFITNVADDRMVVPSDAGTEIEKNKEIAV